MPKRKAVRNTRKTVVKSRKSPARHSVYNYSWNPIWTYLVIALLFGFLVAYFYVSNNERLNSNNESINSENLPNAQVNLDDNHNN